MSEDDGVDELIEYIAASQSESLGFAMNHWIIEAQLEEIEAGLSSDGDVALQRRIGEGRFLAIGAIATVSLSIAVGIMIHPTAFAAAAWKFRRLLYFDRNWRPKVIALFVQLVGVERDVFEAVHWLSLEAIVTNYERYEAEDFVKGMGTEAPVFAQIAAKLEYPDESIATALSKLVRTEVLRSDGSRYWIAF